MQAAEDKRLRTSPREVFKNTAVPVTRLIGTASGRSVPTWRGDCASAGDRHAQKRHRLTLLHARMQSFGLEPEALDHRRKGAELFARLEAQDFDAYLKRTRLPKVSAEVKAAALKQLAHEEILTPSEKTQARLLTLRPLLKYHERDNVLDIKLLNRREAFIGFQGRAVLLISQPALSILSVEELQAAVAHELGHEYFWGEMMEARQQKQHAMMREIELRCDGIALITLHRLGIDAMKMTSAITKIIAFNARLITTDPLYHSLLSERVDFIRAMSELVQVRANSKREGSL